MSQKKVQKSHIFLKSTVIALGIIFLVLVALLVILKINQKNGSSTQENSKVLIDCDQQQIIVINNEIEKVVDAKDEILILTQERAGEQELITLDKKCGFLKRKIKFNIK